ncbi:predicted protein [Uncinocarpus reesii 1704]|uniref:Uncharacterized protein n=1 Tax=Uncinocarpus reesii (strain UAMH 1704) TaxID=336963 RepID=C4K0A4_UNCRE|nr:uncharacterized protein UREG_07918 [Uncinocarpus reesii 1704]EEP83053.1 predicted protein [Uncinocarpus reesii 1704]
MAEVSSVCPHASFTLDQLRNQLELCQKALSRLSVQEQNPNSVISDALKAVETAIALSKQSFAENNQVKQKLEASEALLDSEMKKNAILLEELRNSHESLTSVGRLVDVLEASLKKSERQIEQSVEKMEHLSGGGLGGTTAAS